LAEKRKISKADKTYRREQFMTDVEIREVDDRIMKITQNRSTMGELYEEWQRIETAYRGNQPKKDGRPNTRVNIMNANIEGQIANIIDQNIAISTRGESPSDQNYADFARIGLDWTLRKNKIKKILDQHERRRIKFGNGFLKVHFDPDAFYGFGLARITCVSLNKIFVDKKVKDPLKLQDGEYIAEPIRYSKTQVIDIYGGEKSSALDYGLFSIEDTTVFEEEDTEDDLEGTTIVQWWERKKGKLRLVEFSACGVLMHDSHKGDDRKENQKDSDYSHKSYYEYVNDYYPYFFTVLYPIEGKMLGFGDGILLEPLNDMLNDFYDKIRIAARPHLILFDPDSEVELEDFDENSFEPKPAMLSTCPNAVQSVPWGTVNDSWWRLITQIHSECQRVTRFSDLMTGQGSAAQTATEATIQQQQGNNATDQKKQILQITLQEMCEYILGIMMSNYTEAKAFRLSEDKDDYVWIDFRDMTKVPVMKPATIDFSNKYRKGLEENNKEGKAPKWEILVNEKTKEPITKNVDLDIEINVGAGLPKNKAFLWQMIEKLSSMLSIDEKGMQHSVVSYEELREFIKKFVGLPLEDNQIDKMLAAPMPGVNPQGATSPMQNPNAPLSAGGNPLQGNLPQSPVMGGGVRG
jgi:hypothetical protein